MALMRTLCLLLLVPALASAARVIDEQAIPFTAFMSKADFDQRFPGERLDDPSQLSPGWYVIYEHKALNYYFGPILLEATGRDYLAELRATVEAAVAERPSIEGYRLELSYEPSATSGPGPGESGEPGDASASAGGPQPTARPGGLWGFIRSIFGI